MIWSVNGELHCDEPDTIINAVGYHGLDEYFVAENPSMPMRVLARRDRFDPVLTIRDATREEYEGWGWSRRIF